MSSSDAKRTQHYRSVMPLAPSNSFAIFFFFWLFVWSTAPLSRPDNLQPHHRISSILTSNHESPLLLPQIIWTALRSLDAKMLRNSGGGSDRRAERERERETRRDETRREAHAHSPVQRLRPLEGNSDSQPCCVPSWMCVIL